MATTFKTITANDVTNTRTLLHEAIPLTGTISSGTYGDENIKTFLDNQLEAEIYLATNSPSVDAPTFGLPY